MKKILALAAVAAGALVFSRSRRRSTRPDPLAANTESV